MIFPAIPVARPEGKTIFSWGRTTEVKGPLTGPEGKVLEIPGKLVFPSGPDAGEEGRGGGPAG